MIPRNLDLVNRRRHFARRTVVPTLLLLVASCEGKIQTAVILSTHGGLSFTQQPTASTAGTPLTVVVTALDSLGNVVPAFTEEVTLRIAEGSGTPGARLLGDTSVGAVDGIATFSALTIDSAGSGYGLQIAVNSVSPIVSDTFTISPGPATHLAFTDQPPSTSSGTPFGAVVEARDSLGNTATSYGGDITLELDGTSGTPGASLGGSMTVTAVGGVAAFSFLTVDLPGEGYRLTATAPGGVNSATSAPFGVGQSPVVDPTEPVFNPATQTLLISDTFDSYSTFANVIAAGWLGINAGTSQDYTTDPVNGANLVITDTIRENSTPIGKAIRLKFDGKGYPSTQEGHAWHRTAGFDALAGKPGHALYVSYRFRIVPGAGYNLDTDDGSTKNLHIVKVKWLELWHANAGNRAQFHSSYSTCYPDAPHSGWSGAGTLWNFIGRSAETRCNAGQARAPWAYEGAGEWHRVTHKFMTPSSQGATDGVGQMWYDGTKIVSVIRADQDVRVPGGVNNATWCTADDLANFYPNDYVNRLTLGSVQTAGLWPFSIDYDDFKVWRD